MTSWWKRQLMRRDGEQPSSNLATEDDITACFRLILGRSPNPEELSGHMAQAGRDLPAVVAGYLNSLEFARRGLLQPPTATAQLVERDDYRLYASPEDIAVGQHIVQGRYEPEVEAVFRRLLGAGMGVLDLGANVGYFTMLAAHLVGAGGYVLAVEPNPDNTRLLEASRLLNGFAHVTVAQIAAGRAIGLLGLHATHSNGTTSALQHDALLASRPVACAPIDLLIPAERRINLVKIDVEGAEYNALLGALAMLERDRPVIVSEFSPGLLPGISGIDGPGYLAWLHGLGYEIAVIEPDGGLGPAGREVGPVMAAYERRGTDHIDILARPA